MDWINSQTNLMDSIRYLIELEISRNGVRNLQTHIPAERDLSAMPAFGKQTGDAAPYRNEETAAAAEPELRLPQAADVPDKQPAYAELPDDEIDEEDIESWI
ncbi:hypothetical protein J31TS4_36890 [Paenibacillus sp. J31TS4]|nr:hypothetical protein J31TS4_36890 [Paenibacillus sp. J31TS4]